MQKFATFKDAVAAAFEQMKRESVLVHRGKWQGLDVKKRPEMGAHEILHWSMRVPMPVENLDYYRAQIDPNLPWADDHFAERVCGQPINPGVQWSLWPWGKSADKFRDETGLFNHNYMERYWPSQAGYVSTPTLTAKDYEDALRGQLMDQSGGRINRLDLIAEHRGIRETYGDLRDVVLQLKKDPTTRQAILPVFFPEDTGGAEGGRVPCSIYYQFILSGPNLDKLDMIYHLRSCDLIRHFRDDIYLTVRLLLWMLDQLRQDEGFDDVRWGMTTPGDFVMTIGNFHCFRNDMIQMTRGA
jgi:Thymidylate synthase